MTAGWEPGTQYNYGDVVSYQGHRYKIIQPHRSQGDWAPDIVPALWGRIPDDNQGGDHQQHHQQQPFDAGHNYGQPPQSGYHDEKPHHDEQQQQQQQPEPEKSWFDEHKTELKVGGGIVAGLAALGGAAYALHKHEEHKEERKEQAENAQQWLESAQARTQAYHANGPRGPTTWVLTEGHNIPQGALVGGEEDGRPIYIARAFHKGSMQVGKAAPHFKKGATVGYAHNEIDFGTYEILLGNPNSVRWVDGHGRLNLQSLGARPVEGGYEANGTPLFIAQASIKGSIQPGKISEKLDRAFIPYGGDEKEAKDYRILCYAF
ncbi:hypothetical protein NLI96_g6428 [Meripilus lineatus]|uniref:Chitin-binding type-3 domain-containing protein n=1 Tax=Meripilus lineatus TaxID=2056292 RepID=A0AAD5V1A3_9APHY|nr:hypothetical protein NLI96_g6428 [Physisporinus lineatus]